MTKFLLALDCSAHSQRAADYLARLAPALGDSQVVLFSVLTGVPYTEAEMADNPPPAEVHGDVDYQQEITAARAFLEEVRDRLQAAGFAAERLQVQLSPVRRGIAQDVFDAAVENGCTTIVVGRRGMSRVRKLLLGSVSKHLVHHAGAMTVWVVA
ncbi:MAG: universal stress protein [Desulfuromonadales bacterium]|nr:universal stress protein [Desulfuromonadales bacterium]